MTEIKMNVAMICAYKKCSTRELARLSTINETHLEAVRAGRAKMTADDIIGICGATGLNMNQIETDPAKQ